MWSNLVPNITCIIPGYEEIMQVTPRLKYCANVSSAADANINFMHLARNFVKDPTVYECKVPCKQSSYSLDIEYNHENHW